MICITIIREVCRINNCQESPNDAEHLSTSTNVIPTIDTRKGPCSPHSALKTQYGCVSGVQICSLFAPPSELEAGADVSSRLQGAGLSEPTQPLEFFARFSYLSQLGAKARIHYDTSAPTSVIAS